MANQGLSRTIREEGISIALRIAIVALTLATAYIHYTLGGLMFLMNAAGYAALAVAMVVPFGFAERFRWAPRLALLAFTLVTIVGWVLVGGRFDLAYLTKGIEVALVGLLLIDIYRAYGSPADVAREARSGLSELRAALPV